MNEWMTNEWTVQQLKHENLRISPRIHTLKKGQVWKNTLLITILGEWRQTYYWDFLVSWSSLPGEFQASGRLYPKSKVDNIWEMRTEVILWSPHTHAYITVHLHTHEHVSTHIHIPTCSKSVSFLNIKRSWKWPAGSIKGFRGSKTPRGQPRSITLLLWMQMLLTQACCWQLTATCKELESTSFCKCVVHRYRPSFTLPGKNARLPVSKPSPHSFIPEPLNPWIILASLSRFPKHSVILHLMIITTIWGIYWVFD